MSYIGTLLYTALFGERVGTDEFGNRYYRKVHAAGRYGREKRWVMFKGRIEATKVPPEWHAWLRQAGDPPPSDDKRRRRPWQKPYLPNLTGTAYAYRPKGHDLAGGQRPAATGDYEPWTPS